ncbi:hypothetical protein GCM10027276_05290 [Comamonas piscis]
MSREHGGNCDIQDLSRGSKIFFLVYVDGAGSLVGDLHFTQGDGEITFCGAIEMAGWVHMKVSIIPGSMAKYGIKNPIFKPSPTVPTYNDYVMSEGISVDESGKQYYLDVNVAYKQACLNAIEYLKKFGYAGAQASISGAVDVPNACAALGQPAFDQSIATAIDCKRRLLAYPDPRPSHLARVLQRIPGRPVRFCVFWPISCADGPHGVGPPGFKAGFWRGGGAGPSMPPWPARRQTPQLLPLPPERGRGCAA